MGASGIQHFAAQHFVTTKHAFSMMPYRYPFLSIETQNSIDSYVFLNLLPSCLSDRFSKTSICLLDQRPAQRPTVQSIHKAPSCLSTASSASSTPISRSTSLVCSPCNGARVRMEAGVLLNFIAGPKPPVSMHNDALNSLQGFQAYLSP